MVCVGVLFQLLIGCSPTPPERIVLGQVSALTGPDPMRGQSARQGAAFAVEELNEQQTTQQFTVLHADGKGEPEASRAQADRLAAINRVALVMSGAETRNPGALAAQTAPHGVPLLAAAELPPATDYAFSLATSPAYQGEVLAQLALDELKAKHAVVLTDSGSSVSLPVGSAFVRQFRKGEGRVEELTFKTEAELLERIARIKDAKPDVVLLAGSPQQLLLLRTRLHEIGFNQPLLLGGFEGARSVIASERGSGSSVYLTTGYAVEGLTPVGQEFANKYRERFQQEADVDAMLAYDSVKLSASVMKPGRSVYGVRLRDELARVEEFESLTGPLSFTPAHHARRAVFVLQVTDGAVKMIRRFDPEPK